MNELQPNPPKGLITLTVMLVTVLEVLDMTIVNVALPPMMGSLSANSEEITWVLTSYIVSAAIFMPLTGMLIQRIGQKKLLMGNIMGFCLSSILCGVSSSLAEMVLFRILQGIFGASLVPLSQYILRNTYSEDEQSKAMAFWGMGVMVAPVLGPTLGGYITESLDWRWIFFINIPVCILALMLSMFFINESKVQKNRIDWLGLILMMATIGSFQLFLDQGNTKDWFESQLIKAFFSCFIIGSCCFIFKALKSHQNIINLALYRNKNFMTCSLLILCYMIALFGVMAIQPMMLESLMGYTTEDAGLLMAPRACASAITMAVIAKQFATTDPKRLILLGLIISSISCYLMGLFQLQTPPSTMIWVGFIQGIGMGLFFIPTSTLALSTLNQHQTAEASGLFSLSRSIGSSIGISMISTLTARETQINYHSLSQYISLSNQNLQRFLDSHSFNLYDPQVLQLIANKVLLQSNFNAFKNAYMTSCCLFLLIIPFLYFLEQPHEAKKKQASFEH